MNTNLRVIFPIIISIGDKVLEQDDIDSDEQPAKVEEVESQKTSQTGGPKVSVSNAILDILNTTDEKTEKCPILSKNSRPFQLLAKEKQEKKQKKLKIQENLKIKMQGRVLPTLESMEYEKNLQVIATKGVVRLFNAVSHQQTEIRKESMKGEIARKELVAKKLELDKSKVNSNETILKKIMAKEKKWKVFEDEEGENSEE